MPNGPYKGRADYLELGTYNAVCSMCGRKAKANQLERNWQGLYRHPYCNEPRQPQDFVRNVPDIMTIPWGQPQEVAYVPSTGVTFPLTAAPSPLLLSEVSADLLTEAGGDLLTEAGGQLLSQQTTYVGVAVASVPNWVIIDSVLWSWASGGAGITINTPTSLAAIFAATTSASGVAQCVITNSLGATAKVLVSVTAAANVTDSDGNVVYDSYGNPVTWSG